MAIASITQWLQDPNRSFLRGKALYEQYGENRVILSVIKAGSGNYHFAKLLEGLKKVNEQVNLEPKALVISPIQQPISPIGTKGNPDFTSAPEQVQIIAREKTEKYARARKLFEMIRLMDSRQHRLAAGLELLDLMDEVNEAWSIIDEWKEKGKVREKLLAETEKSVSELSVTELMKEAKNLPTYISKDNKLLKGEPKDAKKVKITARLEVNLKRLELIQKRLAEL